MAPRERVDRGKPKTVEVCRFGQNCKRFDCWFQHPDGRAMDGEPFGGMCKYGLGCNRPDCFYKHPKVLPPKDAEAEAEEAESDDFCIHLDEVEMPMRPEVRPSTTDREVFIDPLPGQEGSAELAEFLLSFGEVDDVYIIENQERGYVRFQSHTTAAECVAARVGAWSESERALAGQNSSSESAYPDALVGHLLGREGRNLQELMEKSGVRKLRLITNSVKNNQSVSGRVHFLFRGTPDQKVELTLHLEELLATAHSRIAKRMEERRPSEVILQGIPEDWSPVRVRELCADIARGRVISVMLVGDGSAIVGFRGVSDAEKAVSILDGRAVPQSETDARFRCELAAPSLGDGADEALDPDDPKCATIFIGGVPPNATEEEIRTCCERVGPVAAIRMKGDKERDAPKMFYAFADFENPDDVPRALRILRRAQICGRRIQIDWSGNAFADPSGKGQPPIKEFASPAAARLLVQGGTPVRPTPVKVPARVPEDQRPGPSRPAGPFVVAPPPGRQAAGTRPRPSSAPDPQAAAAAGMAVPVTPPGGEGYEAEAFQGYGDLGQDSAGASSQKGWVISSEDIRRRDAVLSTRQGPTSTEPDAKRPKFSVW